MTFSTVFSDEQKGVGSVNAEGEADEYETLKHSFTTYFTPNKIQPMKYTNFDRRNRREEKQLTSFTQDLERWQTPAIFMTSNKKY